MANSNNTNVIIHFAEMLKMAILDINDIMTKAYSNYNGNIFKASLKITSVNGQTFIGNESKKYIDFLYNNSFRINGQQIIKNSYNDGFNINDVKEFIIDRTILSPKKGDSDMASYIGNEVYDDLGTIYTLSFDSFNDAIDFSITLNITIVIQDPTSLQLTYYSIEGTAYVDDYRCMQYSFFKNLSKMISSNMESFMLLRTNPKLTGNIKLVVDSDNKLYLDTFKVSTTSVLNKKEYRHQEISSDGDYPHDVYKVFNTVPTGELYNVYPDSYDPHKNYFDLNQQIENIYEYGAEFNADHLYKENMHILAPLYLGKHLPDYFIIFKTDRLLTLDYNIKDVDQFKNMLSDAVLVKLFDLRRSSTIGRYLYNYNKQISEFLAGTCSLLFIELDNDMFLDYTYDGENEIIVKQPNPNYREGRNTWKGLVFDKGILTSKSETSYFANKTLNGENPLENFDMFLLNGFQRNKLIFPNIINFDFMFDDPEADDMSMHNYFGLYLTENDFISFNQIVMDSYKNNNHIYYFDENNNEIKLSDTTINVIEKPEYSDRIFFMSTINDATYVKSMVDVNQFIKNNVVNKPEKNIIALEGRNVKNESDEISFISFDLTEPIKVGEHFRFISLCNYKNGVKESIVLEIIASDDDRLVGCDDYIFPYVLTNIPEYSTDILKNVEVNTKIYRLTFYAMDTENVNNLASLNEQIYRICACINKFDSFIKVSSFDDETIAFISSKPNTYCQHILSDKVENSTGLSIVDPVRYFNYNNLSECYVIDDIIDMYRKEDIPFSLYGFELYGKRYSNMVRFIEFNEYKNNYIYEIYKDVYEELKSVPYPIIATNRGYFPIIKHHVNECHLEFNNYIAQSDLIIGKEIFNSVVSPWDVKCSIIISTYECELNNNVINICSPLQSNVALMGINSIKDLDMYTNIIEYSSYSASTSATFNAGERIRLDNSDPRLRLFTTYTLVSGTMRGLPISSNTEFMITNDSIIYANDDLNDGYHIMPLSTNYILFDDQTEIKLIDVDNIEQYPDYTVIKPVLNSSNYYVDPSNTATSNLLIPLVPMVNCQWRSNGVYFDNESVLNVNDLLNDYTIMGNFVENVYTPAGNSNNLYIVNKISDIINYDSESIMTIKNLILSNKYKGFIKKYLIANFKIDTAIGHYNPNVQTLEFIYYGIQFKIKLSNAMYKNDIKLNEFNNYEVYVINNYDGSLKNEMFINKEDEFILMINHIYCINDLYSTESIKIMNQNNNIENAKYAWYPAIYNYELINFAVLDTNSYLYKDSDKKMATSNVKYIVELDLPIYENTYIDFDEEPIYTYFNIDDKFSTLKGYDTIAGDSDYEHQYSIMTQDTSSNNSYTYTSNISNLVSLYALNNTDYEQKTYDYRQHNTYMVKYQNDENSLLSTFQTNNSLKIQLYMNTFMNGNLDVFIMSKNTSEYKEYNINSDYKPLDINLSIPNKIKFNQGLFDPNFIDIVHFNVTDNIQNEIGLDTLYGNTLIKSIDSILNYFLNKISNTGVNCLYNHFSINERSLLSSCWDNNIYRLYNDDENYKQLPGYSVGIQDKMFFGSTCLVLHNSDILLNKWNYEDGINYAEIITDEHNVNDEGRKLYKIHLNLTKTFYSYIINSNFYDNWSVTDDTLNVKTYINNYINNTLLHYYNFKSNLDLKLYKLYNPAGNKKLSAVLLRNKITKKYKEIQHMYDVDDLTTFVKNEPDDFTTYEIELNIKTEFEEINNEIILSISIPNYDNYYFYPTVKISKY